ncbi:hypothetical protein A2U01_0110343, partial [Trifolium medium]|nr:hypothetical protein [Trifolium medium]
FHGGLRVFLDYNRWFRLVLRFDGSTSRPSGGECDKFLPWLSRKTDIPTDGKLC